MTSRILHIVSSLARGGAQTQLGLLARGLPRAEFEVHVCALDGGGSLQDKLATAEIPLTVIGRHWRFDLSACWRLQRHVSRLRPQLIHTWRAEADAYGGAAAWACGVKHWVATPQAVGTLSGWIERAIERNVVRRSSRMVVSSAAMRECYIDRGLPAERFCVIPSGVPPAAPSHSTRHQVLADLGIPQHHRLIGIVGPLRLHKRIKDTIWAADLLKVIRDDVHLLVIGDGPHSARLRKFRDQVRIRDKVHFLGERADLPRLLPHFDVFWSTSAQDSQGNSILEAMAAGVPVVATNILATRELIIHEATGYLVSVGDRAGITRHTNRLLDNATLAQRLGQAGRQRVLEQFSADRMIQQHVELYRALAAQP